MPYKMSMLIRLKLSSIFRIRFLPRDATQTAVMPRQVVRPSVCPFVTLRYDDHIG